MALHAQTPRPSLPLFCVTNSGQVFSDSNVVKYNVDLFTPMAARVASYCHRKLSHPPATLSAYVPIYLNYSYYYQHPCQLMQVLSFVHFMIHTINWKGPVSDPHSLPFTRLWIYDFCLFQQLCYTSSVNVSNVESIICVIVRS